MKTIVITFLICGTALIALVIAAIAFKSDLRAQLLAILGWSTAGVGLAATLSPIDLIPDFLLGVGQLDDAVYLCAALAGGVLAYAMRRQRHRPPPGASPGLPLHGGPKPIHRPSERR